VGEAERRVRAHVLQEQGHGDVVRLGLGDWLWTDLYHHTMTVGWPVFIGWSVLLYVLVNFGFALLYMMVPQQIMGPHPLHVLDAFFFSVQTLSTVGYGVMAPVGTQANIVVSFEVLIGMMVNALATGVVFARFARPRARLLFSDHAVISTEQGVPTLCVRLANCRLSAVLAVNIEVTLSRLEMDRNGRPVRRFYDLRLQQSHVSMLRFAFVVMHVIDAESALQGQSFEHLRHENAEIIVTVTGTDEATGQSLLARTSYGFDRVRDRHQFANIVSIRPSGGLAVDYARLHDILEETETF